MTPLLGLGISFITDLVSKYGEKVAVKGIEKVTGMDLSKQEITPEIQQMLLDNEIKIKALNFEELKLEIESKLEEKRLDIQAEQQAETNITERWKSDNSADSRFAKLLRPTLTAYLIVAVTLLALLDGNIGAFNIKTQWVDLFTTLCITAVSGYFVLRTYEKRTGTSVWKK